MKKSFTFALALMGFAGVSNAATVDDLAVLKHSYVLVGDDVTNNGQEKIAKNTLFGNGYFFTPTGHDKATNKGSVDLSTVDELGIVTQEIVNKYAEYGTHLNSLRLKTTQDVLAMNVTAKSKIIIFFEKNKDSDVRYPIVGKKADLSEKLSSEDNVIIKGAYGNKQVGRFEWVATDDGVIYIGAENQIFLSYIIVEANEAPGTPTVKVGDQTYEGGLWFREVTCKANEYTMEGTEIGIPTIVTYTTDGAAPTATSPIYKNPIKCYKDMTVKFQAYYDLLGTGTPDEGCICTNADNEANVNFSFDAPTIEANGAQVTITSPYEGAKNFVLIDGDNEEETSAITLEESATVTAYSKIINGDYAEFTTKSTSKDVYVLDPIKENKTIVVTTGTAVIDEEATATSTTGPVYKVEGGAISADKKDFFVKNLTFAVLKDDKAQYQIDGKEIYIQMSNTNITFQVAEGDSVDVKVVCSLNSCKTLESEDESKIDRKCYVNVNGTNYGHDDVTAENGNIIEFGLTAGTHTFQKYSGTGNILISSIEITPAEVDKTGISTVKNEVAKSAIFNLAGQKVTSNFKGIIVKNGKKIFK